MTTEAHMTPAQMTERLNKMEKHIIHKKGGDINDEAGEK